jgi:hypothetical protein
MKKAYTFIEVLICAVILAMASEVVAIITHHSTPIGNIILGDN